MAHPYCWDDGVVDPVLKALRVRVRELRLRPLDRVALDSVRGWYRIHHTYNPNAIEGNTLSHVETRVVVEDGTTIGGKRLKDHQCRCASATRAIRCRTPRRSPRSCAS